MADSQNRSKIVDDKGANFASSVSGKVDTCERSKNNIDEPMPDLLKPSARNVLKHNAQSLMILHHTKAFQGAQHPKVEQNIEIALKEEPLTTHATVSEPLTPKKVELSTLDQDIKENITESCDNFEFDPFAEHSKDEIQNAIEQARINAMKKHELIEDSEFQFKNNAQPQDRKDALFENAKAIADLAMKDGIDKQSIAPNNEATTKDIKCQVDDSKAQINLSSQGAYQFKGTKSPFSYIKTSLERVVPKDRFYIDAVHDDTSAGFTSYDNSYANKDLSSTQENQGLATKSKDTGAALGVSAAGADASVSSASSGVSVSSTSSGANGNSVVVVTQRHSAYDDVFGGDNHHLPVEHHDERLDPSKIDTPFDPLAAQVDTQKSDLEQDVNESQVRHDDPSYWAQGGVEAHEESTLPASAFSSDGPEDGVVLNNNSSQVKCLGVPGIKPKSHNEHNIPFKMHKHVDVADVGVSAHERLGVQGLVSHHRIVDNSMSHYRGGYMPCYFLYDNGEDRYLLDQGSCRLIGITYTGDWIPSSYINNQLSLIDEEQLFSVFFNPSEGNKVFSHVKIQQGSHKGERLYISGSVIQRDDTGIAMLVSGYFTQVQSKYMECLCKFMNHSSSFDIDTFTGEVQFGAAYHVMLGLEDNDRMPRTVKEFEENFIHPEDLMVYRKQNDIIYNPNLGDYYESIYRIKHRGGYYIWCIDRGLVIERKSSGMASRIIGTTTNIDVVRSNFERLKRSIYQDPLTGLHNRFYLNTRYKYFTMEESQPLSLVYVDISGLKVINDYLGHAKGDELVKLSAQILSNDVYLDHEVVRLSGDEFLLIFTNCSDEQCKNFINKFANTLDERNRNREFPLPIYFGFGIATLNEIEDGDTFLRCEARADVRLQEYKTAHRTRIYTELQAFIENALGQKVVFNDNRRLEYLDKEESDHPDVVPSNQLKDEDKQERKLNVQNTETIGLVSSFGSSGKVPHYQGSPYGVIFNSVHPSLIASVAKVEQSLEERNQLAEQQLKAMKAYELKFAKHSNTDTTQNNNNVASESSYINNTFHKQSPLAAMSRMQYQPGHAEASAEVFMEAGLQKIELDFAQELAQAQKQIDARNDAQEKVGIVDSASAIKEPLKKNSAFEIKSEGTKGSYGSGDVYQVAKSSVPDELVNQNSLTISWDQANANTSSMSAQSKISAEQERLLILAAEQAALDDMRYAQNSVTMPDDLIAGFGSLEVGASDLNKESKILDKAHKIAKAARLQDGDQIDNGPNLRDSATLEVGEQVSSYEAKSALHEAQAFLNKLQDAKPQQLYKL